MVCNPPTSALGGKERRQTHLVLSLYQGSILGLRVQAVYPSRLDHRGKLMGSLVQSKTSGVCGWGRIRMKRRCLLWPSGSPERARPWVRGTQHPNTQPRLSHPTALRDPKRARCEPPRETTFIFPSSYDNTWPCLFNFQLWTAVRWDRKIGLAPFKTQQPTHHEKTPTQTLSSTLQEDIWPTAGREGPWGWGKAAAH